MRRGRKMITMVIMARPDNRNTMLSQVAEQKLSGIRRLGMGPFVVT